MTNETTPELPYICPNCKAPIDFYEYAFDVCYNCFYHDRTRPNECTLPNQANNRLNKHSHE